MNGNLGPRQGEATVQGPPRERQREQYSLAKILGIWALAAVPMGVLGWIVFPLLAPDFESDPLGAGVTRLVLPADSLADVLREMSARLESRAEEAAELRVRLELTERAQSTLEDERRQTLQELEEERRRREEAERERDNLHRELYALREAPRESPEVAEEQ
jgi:hypothetical protein